MIPLKPHFSVSVFVACSYDSLAFQRYHSQRVFILMNIEGIVFLRRVVKYRRTFFGRPLRLGLFLFLLFSLFLSFSFSLSSSTSNSSFPPHFTHNSISFLVGERGDRNLNRGSTSFIVDATCLRGHFSHSSVCHTKRRSRSRQRRRQREYISKDSPTSSKIYEENF